MNLMRIKRDNVYKELHVANKRAVVMIVMKPYPYSDSVALCVCVCACGLRHAKHLLYH